MRRAGRGEGEGGFLASIDCLDSCLQVTGISQSLSVFLLGCDEVGERLSTEPKGGSEERKRRLTSLVFLVQSSC